MTARLARARGVPIAASMTVLLFAAGFYGYAYLLVHGAGRDAYTLQASFLSSSGLSAGADVVLAGVAIGRVQAIRLDDRTMVSRVRFTIDRALHLPIDSQISIGSGSLMSDDALIIRPGHSLVMMKPDAIVSQTCASTNLEQQISQYIFGSGASGTDCTD